MTTREKQVMRQVRQAIRSHGWFCMGVLADANNVNFTYTVGLTESFQHPEIITWALPSRVAHEVFSTIVTLVKAGEPMEVDKPTPGILGNNYDVLFRRMRPSYILEHMGVARRHYDGSPKHGALVMLWPDPEGVFPTLEKPGLQIDALAASEPL